MGLFNSVPAFENLCEDVETPKMATTFHAQADQLHPCLIRDGTLDLCHKYGVPSTHMQDSSGTLATAMTAAQRKERRCTPACPPRCGQTRPPGWRGRASRPWPTS